MWLLCQQRTGFGLFFFFLKDLRLQKAEGKFMERVVADTLPGVPPPKRRGGAGTAAPGRGGSFADPPPSARRSRGGPGSSRRVTWAARRGLGALHGAETRAPPLCFVLS